MDNKELNRIATEYPEWTDMLGNTYRPGDYGVYAITRGTSPALVFGQVVRINRMMKNGKSIVTRRYDYEAKVYIETPSCSLTIRRIESATRSGTRDETKSKLTTIHDPFRFVKIESSYITQFEELRDALSRGQRAAEGIDSLGGSEDDG